MRVPIEVSVHAFYTALLLHTSDSNQGKHLERVRLLSNTKDGAGSTIVILRSLTDMDKQAATTTAMEEYKQNGAKYNYQASQFWLNKNIKSTSEVKSQSKTTKHPIQPTMEVKSSPKINERPILKARRTRIKPQNYAANALKNLRVKLPSFNKDGSYEKLVNLDSCTTDNTKQSDHTQGQGETCPCEGHTQGQGHTCSCEGQCECNISVQNNLSVAYNASRSVEVMIDPLTPTHCFSSIQNNVWKSSLYFSVFKEFTQLLL